mgnify:CR=1 FL=1
MSAAVSLCFTLSTCAVVPEPIETAEMAEVVDASLDRVTANQEPVRHSIDVYEAMARALKYNLDQRVELMQEAVKFDELRLASYQGLPGLVAQSAYSARDNILASSSQSILTGRESLEPSTSTDRKMTVDDVTLSWNILDFGLSYVRARQAADQVLVQHEARRRALNRIVEDVRTAYWRAIASERLISRLRDLEAKTRRALANSRDLANERLTSPVVALTYERELLEIRREAQRIEGDLRVARSQLAALMNLPPEANFRLSGMPASVSTAHLRVEPRKLLRIALMNRPETRDVAYKIRINEKEIDAALLELLPGLNPFASTNFDSNDFLVNNNWLGWGARASWNLMKVFQFPAKRDLIEAQGQALDVRTMALTMAIMTQVHVSRVKFVHAQRELQTSSQIREVQRRLLANVRESTATDKTSEQTLIREHMNMIVSEVRYDLAFANLQNAYANIFASLGLDAFPSVDIDSAKVDELAGALRKTWIGWGDLSIINSMDRITSELIPETAATSVAVKSEAPNRGGSEVTASFSE